MQYGLTAVTVPPYEPLSLAEAKLHLRVDHSADDVYIAALIRAARNIAEGYTGLALVQQTWDMTLEGFCAAEIRIPRPPLQSITWIKYFDSTGTLQTWDAAEYDVDNSRQPGRIQPSYGNAYPATRYQMNAVTIRFVAGYPVGSPQDQAGYSENVPDEIKCAMKLIIGHYYEHREDVVDLAGAGGLVKMPHNSMWLLNPLRVSLF